MPYEPQEDSYLLEQEVRLHAKGTVLDMGTGSCIQGQAAIDNIHVERVVAVDIDPGALKYCKEKIKDSRITFVQSDLFENVDGKFDTIIFNPPYLPEQEGEDATTARQVSGGRQGHELIARFLKQANDYLKEDGIILILFSTLTGADAVKECMRDCLMDFEQLNSKKIAFETLYVYTISKNRFRKELEKKSVKKIRPLAKGHRGLIFTGAYQDRKITIKIQRTDIGAAGTVDNEIVQLKRLNQHNIGPHMLFYGVDYFAYDYVEGDFILDFLAAKTTTRDDVLKVIRDVLQQMRKLDQLGLNKEEMHHPVKHIIITPEKKAVLLDFERCKPRDKVHNVTQFVQFLISGHLKPAFERFKIEIDKDRLLELAKAYSEDYSDTAFKSILDALK